MNLLSVQGLQAFYGRTQALFGVDLSLAEGEAAAVLGANGAGKTTLLRALCAMVRHEGAVVLRGENLAGLATEDIARRGVAHVPQGRGTFTRLTAAENLALGAAARRDRAGIAADVDRVYGWFPRLAERRGQQAGTLSGGEQQMLAVGRALMSRPRLLLMDEPSLGLAPLVVEEIFDIIAQLHRDGTTIFLVEQNAHMALKVAKHFFLMEQGRVTFSGDPGSLAEDEVIRRAYLGSKA